MTYRGSASLCRAREALLVGLPDELGPPHLKAEKIGTNKLNSINQKLKKIFFMKVNLEIQKYHVFTKSLIPLDDSKKLFRTIKINSVYLKISLSNFFKIEITFFLKLLERSWQYCRYL